MVFIEERPGEYKFFSSVHGTFTDIDPELGHQTSVNSISRENSYRLCSQTTAEEKYESIKLDT